MTEPQAAPWPATAFDLLFDELERSCGFTPAQTARAKVVMASWGGQVVRVPSARRLLLEAAMQAAARMHSAGTPLSVARVQLVGMGLSRATAYRVLRLAAKPCAGVAHGAT